MKLLTIPVSFWFPAVPPIIYIARVMKLKNILPQYYLLFYRVSIDID